MSDDDPRALLALAHAAALDAGRILLAMREGDIDARTKSSPTDMVSAADHAADDAVLERILGARPHDAVLSEERGAVAGTSGVRWVIDPLDGTTNYLYGITAWAVSIAAEVAGEVRAAIVHAPALGETYAATFGGGATRNDARLAVSGNTDLATALVGTGFGYDAEWRGKQGRTLAALLPHIRDVRRSGAAALDLCSVACGRLDAYYERGVQAWDLAAGVLILHEAGGRSSAIEGGPVVPGSVVAATPALLEPLRAAIVAAEERAGGPRR